MGVLIVLIIIVFYIVSYYIAFRLPIPMTKTTFPKYERLRYGGRMFGFFSWIFLIIVLMIHAAAYFAFVWGVKVFSFLLWVNDRTDDEDTYISQVIIICFLTMLPYGKYSFSLVSRFKKQLFKYLQTKYKTSFKVLDSKKFISTLNAKNLSRYALTGKDLRETMIDNHSDKDKRYTSSISVDDVLFFEDKKISISESSISVKEEHYRKDDEGDYEWVTENNVICFTGLIIIVEKPKVKDRKTNRYTKSRLYKINNDLVLSQSDPKRIEKKHGLILSFFFGFFGGEYKDTIIKESLGSLKNIENLENYNVVSESFSEIAETLNVDYVMEDNKRVYLFHKEKNIDFFTYYQNEKTLISSEIFEQDFKLLLEISERF